jgi:hypothetical protein
MFHTNHFDDPIKLASLSLTLLQSSAFDALEAISSIFLKQRLAIQNSHDITDKLPLFTQWSGVSGITLGANDSTLLASSKMSHIRTLIFRFDPMDDWKTMQTFYRIWDEETTHAVVRFAYNSFTNTAPTAARDFNGGAVILYKSGPDQWSFHELKAVQDWGTEYGHTWFLTLEEAKRAYKDRIRKVRASGRRS